MDQLRRIKRLPSKIITSTRHIYGSLFGHEDYARFAAVSHARTGSNYLMDGLATSGSVRMYHELFAEHNRQKGHDFEKILSVLYGKQGNEIKHVGFKLFYYHLTDEEWTRFLTHEEFKFLHLTRRNRLRTIVSLDIAFKTDRWTAGATSMKTAEKRIALDPNKLMERIEAIEEHEKIIRKRLADREMIEVVYEDATNNPDGEFKRVADFLGITDIDPHRIIRKRQNPEHLRELLLNFDEISEVLRLTRFAEYLNS